MLHPTASLAVVLSAMSFGFFASSGVGAALGSTGPNGSGPPSLNVYTAVSLARYIVCVIFLFVHLEAQAAELQFPDFKKCENHRFGVDSGLESVAPFLPEQVKVFQNIADELTYTWLEGHGMSGVRKWKIDLFGGRYLRHETVANANRQGLLTPLEGHCQYRLIQTTCGNILIKHTVGRSLAYSSEYNSKEKIENQIQSTGQIFEKDLKGHGFATDTFASWDIVATYPRNITPNAVKTYLDTEDEMQAANRMLNTTQTGLFVLEMLPTGGMWSSLFQGKPYDETLFNGAVDILPFAAAYSKYRKLSKGLTVLYLAAEIGRTSVKTWQGNVGTQDIVKVIVLGVVVTAMRGNAPAGSKVNFFDDIDQSTILQSLGRNSLLKNKIGRMYSDIDPKFIQSTRNMVARITNNIEETLKSVANKIDWHRFDETIDVIRVLRTSAADGTIFLSKITSRFPSALRSRDFAERVNSLPDLKIGFKQIFGDDGKIATGTLFEYDPISKTLFMNEGVSPKFFDSAPLDVAIYHELTDVIAIKNATTSVIDEGDGVYTYIFNDETLEFFDSLWKTGRLDKYSEKVIKINLKNQGKSTTEILEIMSNPADYQQYMELARTEILPQDLFDYIREKDSFLQQTEFYETFVKPKDLHAQSPIMDDWLTRDVLDKSVDGRGKTVGEHVRESYEFELEMLQIDNAKIDGAIKPVRAPDFWYKTGD